VRIEGIGETTDVDLVTKVVAGDPVASLTWCVGMPRWPNGWRCSGAPALIQMMWSRRRL
jgi:hypothetical protein